MANIPFKDIKFPDLPDTYTVPEVDTTLSTTGAAADAKKTGDEITALKADLTAVDSALSLSSELVYVSGGVVTGSFNTDNTRIRSMPFVISAGDVVKSDGTYAMFVAIYNSITQSTISYEKASGSWGTADIDLSDYAGKLGVIAIRKVGSETSNISADVPTINEHIKLKRICKIARDYTALVDSYGLTTITYSDFFYANISTAGVITWLVYASAYSNALSRDIIKGKFKIIPLTDNIMFRIVKYNDNDEWIENSPWYSKNGTSISTATTGVEITGKFRLMIATTTQNQNASVASMLADLGIYAVNCGDASEGIILPFDGFRIDIELKKIGGEYSCEVNPYDNFITVENGVVGFIAPDGNDSNSGLDVLHPKRTFASVFGISNIQTVVLEEGTYTAGTHFTNGMEITQAVNLVGDGNVIIDNGTGSPLNFYRSIFCENIHFKGGFDALIVKLGTIDRTATFINCKFSESMTGNGLTIQGGTCICINCEAYDNAYDGFNYHMYNSIVNHALEVDCRGYGNGRYNITEADGQSSNATTSHDGSYIVRVNGDYKCCHGGIVADKECYSANYGCKAGISTVTDATNYPDRMSNYWSRAATMYLYDCDSYGSKYDTAKIENGTIISNKEYASNYAA